MQANTLILPILNTTDSFKFKTKIRGQTDNDGRINDVEIMIPLKYLSNIWRTLEIYCEVKLIFTWPENCVIISTNVANQYALHLQQQGQIFMFL